MILLQTLSTDSLAAADSLAMNGAAEQIGLLDLLIKGGYMMIPLYLLFILAIYIFIERLMTLKKASKTPAHLLDQVKVLVASGQVEKAKMLCADEKTPIANMIAKGVERIGSPLKNIEVSIENVGKIEIYKLEKNLSLLATVSGAAPMIGFLGTVAGMIQAFIAIAQEEGMVSPKLLSEGIYEAMITTATGLVVGILAYLGYNYLVTQVSKLVHRMEYASIEFIELLQEK
ncbi:MotA/TolQ/ExbB proton channel family protein [Algoriphagus sp. NF]|jgi:biopolymer transport protein ExbB|uniref:MotA/TolQ/ExbB proton channel family protein n=1 Tax=Algoriphagus marincola TaxID=264027 RepID=A0ABS7N1Y7_9BACT|nr:MULTISPECIES: MotA/TolQ/ExbB proton channel family protein [Algoriphagus]MBY5950001.1 MotA/TolQ/ExbB proton channel family protein [Algoriphagus marincola]MCR9082519.1 MotA/TolQ/ExbB proton channel family protein [Cyclobacteriaceae bacterium]MDE0560825.1 MotA/TolQ/ExbB proton channel family protein [Algoriphagus sp. NF]